MSGMLYLHHIAFIYGYIYLFHLTFLVCYFFKLMLVLNVLHILLFSTTRYSVSEGLITMIYCHRITTTSIWGPPKMMVLKLFGPNSILVGLDVVPNISLGSLHFEYNFCYGLFSLSLRNLLCVSYFRMY